jgi:thiol-disulfide isomerase/thioredoxin
MRPVPLRRGSFLVSAAALVAAPAFAKPEAAPKAHEHGLNSAKLPLNTPIQLHIRVLDGPDFDLVAQRGRVVAMNFFATWCGPCREEAADVAAFASAHADDLVVVSVNYRESDDQVRNWRKKHAISYPLAMDEHGFYFHNIGLKAFPTTIFFRADGTVSCVHVGSLGAAELEAEYRLALGADEAPASPTPSPAPAPS